MRVTVTNQENHYTAITEIQLFNEGGDREVVENQAPQVKVSVDESKAENMKAVLTAECIDDGMPYDKELTYKWEVIGKPEGASAFLLNEQSLNTTLVASAAGAYTVRFTANDGEKSASEELGVEIREMEVSRVDAAVNAKPSSDFTASWENLNGVNDPTFEPSSSNVGTNKGWGNWGCSGGTGSEHWIGYTWNEKVSINELAIYWYDDGGGTRVPRAYRLQYKNDAGEWTDAEILTDIKNASRKNAYNTIEIQPVTTKELRLYVTLSAAGTGIYRFKTYETPAKEIHPVYAATKTGVIPTLPEYVTVVLSTGEMKEQTVRWNEITQEMVAQDGTFEVTGINGTTGDIVTATVIARSDMDKATISTVDAVEVSTIAGNLPYLPKTVKVGYNNGAQDSVSVKVTWPEITLEQVGKPGASFTVEGDVEGTSAKARLTVHVMGDTVDTSKLEEALENAKKYSQKDYTAESYGKLASAIAEAQDLLENPEATNTQINAAVAAINDAIDRLVEKKAQLRSLLAEAKALEPEKYTAESYAVLEEAIKGAEAVVEDSEAADTAIADAVKALQDAMEKLEKVTEAELILHYTFDKQEDITQIKDESASAYTVQVPGLKTDDFVEGAAGTALKFRGEDTSFEIPAKADLATSDITLSYWFKRTGTLTGNNSLLWAKNESAYNGNGFYTNYPVGDRYSSFFVVDGFNGFYVAENPNDFLPLNEWTYITVTWDSDKNEGKIYKNGVEQKITTLGSPDTITGTESAVNRIGKNGYSSDAQYPANLQLDDMRIYNGVLPAADVEAMYTEAAVKDVEKAVAEAEAYEKSMYTPESYAKLQETIEAAKRFLAGEVTAEGCKAQIQALREAIEGLKIPADKTSLKALIKAAGEMDVTGYTEESAAVFKAALKDAQDVSDDPEASKEDVAAAEAKLLTALAELERTKEESVDLSMVRILKEAYKDIDTSKYTESSAKTFTDAMAGLDKVLNKENPTQEEADQAASDLLKAAIKLELRQEIPVEETDLTILGILYEAYRDMNLTGYTEETAEVLRDALKAAKSLLESRDATQEEADLAAAQIVKAAAGLQEVPADPEPQPETKPDDTVLRTLVQAYETLDVSSYTEATGTEMVSARKAAKDLLARADATQAEIDQAAARLINAAANLVVKAAEPVVPEKPALKKGQTFTYKGLKYKVTNPAQGKAQAAVTGAKSKSAKTVVIPPAVTLNGVKCKVTEISAKAFYKFKKLRKVTIGANVTKIGKQAFYGDSALKFLNVRTKSLKSVGSKALKGINKKAVIKVPSSKRAAYKKVLKNKGQSSTVNIK